jgi:hypothetical protein
MRTRARPLQVPAEQCELVEAVKEHRGKSEPLFLFFRVRGLLRPLAPAAHGRG